MSERPSTSDCTFIDELRPNEPSRVFNIIIAIDKWKDCMSSLEIGSTVEKIIKTSRFRQRVNTKMFQVSDGGDGFLASLKTPLNLQLEKKLVIGSLGEKVWAEYGFNKETKIGVVEIASASGLASVPLSDRNPFNTTSYGTGQLIQTCAQLGCTKIYVGLGGSSTVDGGIGALQALGAKIFVLENNQEQEPLVCFGRHLCSITRIQVPTEGILPGCEIFFSHDVRNPMIGPNGAVNKFSAQKGAKTTDMREALETGMVNLATLLTKISHKPIDFSKEPGTGAAGGIGGSFLACCRSAQMIDGMDLFLKLTQIEAHIQTADLVITGEGKWDSTSSEGKAPWRISQIAENASPSVSCIVLCGKYEGKTSPQQLRSARFELYELLSFFDLETSMHNTPECLQKLFDREVFGKNNFFVSLYKDIGRW